MAPAEGRVAKPERRWECHCGTPGMALSDVLIAIGIVHMSFMQRIYLFCGPVRRVWSAV